MARTTTEYNYTAGTGQDAEPSALRIDSEVFEALSTTAVRKRSATSPRMVRWFETWSSDRR